MMPPARAESKPADRAFDGPSCRLVAVMFACGVLNAESPALVVRAEPGAGAGAKIAVQGGLHLTRR